MEETAEQTNENVKPISKAQSEHLRLLMARREELMKPINEEIERFIHYMFDEYGIKKDDGWSHLTTDGFVRAIEK